jgi:hypothetical protein
MSGLRLKTFVEPSHVSLELQFENWAKSLPDRVIVVETHLVYSAALQKFVMSVIYDPKAGKTNERKSEEHKSKDDPNGVPAV